MKKILKGLNSNTMNYMEANKKQLNADKHIPMFMFKTGYGITSGQFFSQCVRINKPCHLQGLAATWPVTKEINT